MTDMEKPVRFRRESSDNTSYLASCQILLDDATNKIASYGMPQKTSPDTTTDGMPMANGG